MSKKILLADDSVTIQKVITITFASEDYELEVVGDGDAAIRKAKEFLPDIILADVAMPGKTGYEVSEIIKKDRRTSHIPVLLLAGTFELDRDTFTAAVAFLFPAALIDILVFPLARITGTRLGLYIIPPLIFGTFTVCPYVLASNRTSVATDTLVQMKNH